MNRNIYELLPRSQGCPCEARGIQAPLIFAFLNGAAPCLGAESRLEALGS